MAKYFFEYYFSNKFPDQWSPLNTEGKKQYGRDLLMALAKDPLSVRKPENLPSMDIIKDSINPRAGPGISGLPHSQSKDWTPGFVKSTTSRTGANTKQGSRDRYVWRVKKNIFLI